MVKIKLVAVGKVKEKFYRDAIDEYAKRLSKYCKFEVIEVADEKTPDKCSEIEEQLILSKEADKIVEKAKEKYNSELEAVEKFKTASDFVFDPTLKTGKVYFVCF